MCVRARGRLSGLGTRGGGGGCTPTIRLRPGLTLHWHCPLVLLQSGSKPLPTAQWQGPHTGFPHQPLGHGRSILLRRQDGRWTLLHNRPPQNERKPAGGLEPWLARFWAPSPALSGLSFPCLPPPPELLRISGLTPSLEGPMSGRVLPTELLF